MEVSGKIPPLSKTPYVQQTAKPAAKQSGAPVAAGDRVELSVRAKELQAAREAIAKMDDVDHEKVARIKAQIQAGTYRVDAEKIAAKMVDESLSHDLE